MVVDYLHILRILTCPPKANSPLIVDTDGILALTLASERLQTIPGRAAKVRHSRGGVDHVKFTQRDFSYIGKRPGPAGIEKPLGLRILEALYH
jgi:hypothetical protein